MSTTNLTQSERRGVLIAYWHIRDILEADRDRWHWRWPVIWKIVARHRLPEDIVDSTLDAMGAAGVIQSRWLGSQWKAAA
jgi:hypothetical protein